MQVPHVTMEEPVQILILRLNADVLQDSWEIDVKLKVNFN